MTIYSTIKIEGDIFSGDILDKVANIEDGVVGQLNTDFYFDKSIKVKDKISEIWADLNDYWRIFKRKSEKLSDKDTGTTEVRNFLMAPFFEELAYEIELDKNKKEFRGINYPISHKSNKINNFPIHIIGMNQNLDKRINRKHSPHGLLQEYINLTDNLYGIVTNGLVLRLLRDSSRFIKLSYIEFNLEKMFDEGHFADFALLYRMLHASRMDETNKKESFIETYHQDALESGAAIRNSLSKAVENSIKLIANKFIQFNPDHFLKENETRVSAKTLYKEILYLIYKKLFLFVIEERKLVFTEEFIRENKEKVDIYYNWYSLSRVRNLSEKNAFYNKKHFDLWQGIIKTFQLFEKEEFGKALGIKPLSGTLFSSESMENITRFKLDNKTIIKVFRSLTIFEDNGVKRRVNYSALNVEEFGSVYESLLEFTPVFQIVADKLKFSFKEGDDRSSSGSHYTPDELVKPLIDNSLIHLIDNIKGSEKNPENIEKALLNLKICDPASGSGHLLLNSARKIGFELAKVRNNVDQPSAKDIRKGVRDAIQHCIYGVDKNELAVELCKVALWLEAHNPGEPLNFLDHKIKHGDAVVGIGRIEELENGISDDVFNKIAGDDAKIATEYRNSHKKQKEDDKLGYKSFLSTNVNQTFDDLLKKYRKINQLMENTPEEIEIKRSEYQRFKASKEYEKLKNLADLIISPYFISKTEDNKNYIPTYDNYKEELSRGLTQDFSEKVRYANDLSFNKSFFHWFLEFPEVFIKGGFDLVIGNPPFLGGRKISGSYGDNYLYYLKSTYSKAGGLTDFVAYFFRRAFDVIKQGRFLSFISTNTISQGDTRIASLDEIYKNSGVVNFVVRSKKWPGKANVSVSLLSVYKGSWINKYLLDNKRVDFINPYLTDDKVYENPKKIKENENKAFIGSVVLGLGFTMTEQEATKIINGAVGVGPCAYPQNSPINYKDVLFPYLNGADLNRDPLQRPSRWVINFFDWDEDKCKDDYPICYDIVEIEVKPQRDLVKRKIYRENWWQYAEKGVSLYSTIKGMERILVVSLVSKYLLFSFKRNKHVFSHNLGVISFDKYHQFAMLQSDIYTSWGWRYSSTMKTDLNYSPSKAFQTYPFPNSYAFESLRHQLEDVGERYYNLRQELTIRLWLGLTKLYNLFHKKDLSVDDIVIPDEDLRLREKIPTPSDTSLTPLQGGELSYKEYYLGKIIELRKLHKEMDELVLSAYGWDDIDLGHDFHEVDYLPENDRVRYTISPKARKEVLKRLLELNFKRSKEEEEEALLSKSKGNKSKKDKEVGKSLF